MTDVARRGMVLLVLGAIGCGGGSAPRLTYLSVERPQGPIVGPAHRAVEQSFPRGGFYVLNYNFRPSADLERYLVEAERQAGTSVLKDADVALNTPFAIDILLFGYASGKDVVSASGKTQSPSYAPAQPSSSYAPAPRPLSYAPNAPANPDLAPPASAPAAPTPPTAAPPPQPAPPVTSSLPQPAAAARSEQRPGPDVSYLLREVEDRLRELKAQREQGKISEEEYSRERRELLLYAVELEKRRSGQQ